MNFKAKHPTMRKKLILLILPFILCACNSDEPDNDYGLFHITLGMEAGADVEMGTHSAKITINGYMKDINVGIIGEYDFFEILDDMPDWMTVTPSDDNHFFIHVAEQKGSESRTGKICFEVFKGNESQMGEITIIQNAITLADMKSKERKAMHKYLKKFDIVDELPSINDIQVSSVAPYYKLDAEGNVYMQVVRLGTAPAATKGETICFRFIRYNLLSYLENGRLPEGQGNLNDITQDATYFKFGSSELSTTQWGTAIQLPLAIGLPADSEVNLVVASDAGFTSDISSVIPFLYNIRYYTTNR